MIHPGRISISGGDPNQVHWHLDILRFDAADPLEQGDRFVPVAPPKRLGVEVNLREMKQGVYVLRVRVQVLLEQPLCPDDLSVPPSEHGLK
jgi:hypothetical protein